MTKRVCLIFILFVFLLPVHKSSAQTSDDKTSLGTVTVVDSSEESSRETGDVVKEESSAFYSVIKREEFEGRTDDLAEVIEKETGVQVRQTGGLGSYSSVSLRGASSQQVLIYLDGILLNDASGGGVDLSSISMSDIESIEIYRGKTPINFGRASMGGAINIRTKRSKKKGLNGSVSAGLGSFGTYKGGVFFNHKPGKFDYLLNAGYIQSDNDFSWFYDHGTQWNTSDDTWETRQNNASNQKNFLARAGYDFTPNARLIVSNRFFDKYQQLPTITAVPGDASLSTTRNISNVKLTVNDISSLHINTSAGIDFKYKYEEYDDKHSNIGLNNQHREYTTYSFGYNQYIEWATEYNILELVLDFHREIYDAKDLLGASRFSSSARNAYSAGIEDSILLFNERLIVKPGFRFLYTHDSMAAGLDLWEDPYDATEKGNAYYSPQLGIIYRLFKWLSFKSNLARYTREPSFLELFGDRGYFYGNHELKAESGLNFDAGAELYLKRKDSFVNRISVKAAYFRNDADNLIVFSYDARGIGTANNISAAIIQGTEVSFSVGLSKYFMLSGNYTWQVAKNYGDDPMFYNYQLPGQFEDSLAGKIEAKFSWVKIFAEYVYEKGMYYDPANLLLAPNKNEINAGASISIWDLTFTFEAKNIGNSRYRDFHNYPQPGRSYYG
ncbi:MAG: TonB-dependent receptor, partial [bacterium]|nr:TonB-dependent receptor [bacterium]